MTIFVEKSEVFTGTFDNLDFPIKTVKFTCKNWQIFFKKIVISQENLHLYFPELRRNFID